MSDDTTITPAPTIEAATPAPAAVEPAADPAPAQRVEDLPEWAQKQIADARREAASSRVNAKATAAEEARQEVLREFAKTLGLTPDDKPVDPAALTQQLTAAQADAQAARLENAIFRAASAAGVDANALTDSRAFMTAAATIDPTDTAALAAAIATATTTNPTLITRQAPQAAAVGGADTVGGTGTVRTYTAQQVGDPAFFKANRSEILSAMREGRIQG